MGFRVDIQGLKVEISDYSVTEASTPLAAGDSISTAYVAQLASNIHRYKQI